MFRGPRGGSRSPLGPVGGGPPRTTPGAGRATEAADGACAFGPARQRGPVGMAGPAALAVAEDALGLGTGVTFLRSRSAHDSRSRSRRDCGGGERERDRLEKDERDPE